MSMYVCLFVTVLKFYLGFIPFCLILFYLNLKFAHLLSLSVLRVCLFVILHGYMYVGFICLHLKLWFITLLSDSDSCGSLSLSQ